MAAVAQVLARVPQHLVTRDRDVVATYTTDFRRECTGTAAAVLRPRTTAEVQQIVRDCACYGVGLVPQGGNTGYCGGATPSGDSEQLVVSLERMDRIREIDDANLSATVESGLILGDLQRYVLEAGLMLPLSLGSRDWCRIGGVISSNAGGASAIGFGVARDLVLGIEAVLPDGSVMDDLRPLRGNHSGYDLKQLFVGAEGTLGIVTAVSLELVRRPRQVITAFLAVCDLADISVMLGRAQALTGGNVTSFEYISHATLDLLLRARSDLRHPLASLGQHYVLVEAMTASPILNLGEAFSAFLEEVAARGMVVDCMLAAGERQRMDLWHVRESLPEAELDHGGSAMHDVAVRSALLPKFVRDATAMVRSFCDEAIVSAFGHAGHGNIQFNVLPRPGADRDKRWIEREISPRIYDLVDSMGGSFSGEHGVGRTKLGLAKRHCPEERLALTRRVKDALDPLGLMNPGKVVVPR